MGIRPATPGTLVVLAAFILLLLVSVSVPILKPIYFLKAQVNVSVATVSDGGTLTMGAWGYCVRGTCSSAKLGYSLDNLDAIIGIEGDVANILGNIPNSLIKGLTYALILHPIAAGFAGISFLFGLLSHVREFSLTGWSMLFASFGTFFSLLAFVFDIIAFSIARSRIQKAQSSVSVSGVKGNVDTGATLGNAIWMTLAAFVCLLTSGCFFCIGRTVIRGRGDEGWRKRDKNRERERDQYASQMREEAIEAEKRRNQNASYTPQQYTPQSEKGLPAFNEYGLAGNYAGEEHVPLTSMRDEVYQDNRDREERINGVGMGYGARQPTNLSAESDGSVYPPQPIRQPSVPRRTNSPPKIVPGTREPFTGMYDERSDPNRQPTEGLGYATYTSPHESPNLVGPHDYQTTAPSYFTGSNYSTQDDNRQAPYSPPQQNVYSPPQHQGSLGVPGHGERDVSYGGYSNISALPNSQSQNFNDPYSNVQPHDYHDRQGSGYTDYPPSGNQARATSPRSPTLDPYSAINDHIAGRY